MLSIIKQMANLENGSQVLYVLARGTVVANGATAVAVALTAVEIASHITLSLNTIGGTPAGIFVSAIAQGTGFSIKGTAGDTSTYNYVVYNPQ
jgi:hypothetical protein